MDESSNNRCDKGKKLGKLDADVVVQEKPSNQ